MTAARELSESYRLDPLPREQGNGYQIRLVTFASGERIPLLLLRRSGTPCFKPTLCCTTHLRARGRVTETLYQALRAVMVLQLALDHLGIDLELRMRSGRLLERSEIDEIARNCRLPLEAIVGRPLAASQLPRRLRSITQLARVRMRAQTAPPQVISSTAAIRVHYICDYLKWLTNSELFSMGSKANEYSALKASSQLCCEVLSQLTPAVSSRRVRWPRKGFTASKVEEILAVMHPESQANPWNNAHTRIRNYLIAQWFAETQKLLAQSEDAQSQGLDGADRWTEHQRRTLARVEQILEVCDDETVPNGAVIQPALGSVTPSLVGSQETQRLLGPAGRTSHAT